MITDEAGLTLENVRREYLGSAPARDRHRALVHVRRGRAAARRRCATRLGQIRQETERAPHENDREVARERLAKLASKLAVIHVGGATDVVLNEKRHRTEGALAATRAAVAEGIVSGGGTALLRAEQRARRPRARGRLRGRRRPRAPRALRAAVLDRHQRRLRRPGRGRPGPRDAGGRTAERAHRRVRRPLEAGVIDPVRVTRLTIENAASVAALLLTTEAVVAEELIAQPGAIIAPGFGDLAEGLARPSSPV